MSSNSSINISIAQKATSASASVTPDTFRAAQVQEQLRELATFGDPVRQQVADQVRSLARERGKTLSDLTPGLSPGGHADLCQRLRSVEEQLQEVFARNSAIFTTDRAFHQQILSLAQRTENESRFASLANDFCQVGFHLGQSNGRTVHERRHSRALSELGTLLAAAKTHHIDPCGAAPRAALPPAGPSLEEALVAASRLGEREGISNLILSDISATRIFQSIAGWRSAVPWRLCRDYGAVQKTLSGLTRAEAGQVEGAYRELAGHDLKEDLLAAFGPKKAAHLFLLIDNEDERAGASVVKSELKSLLRFSSSRGEAILKVYEKLSAKQIEVLERHLEGMAQARGTTVEKMIGRAVPATVAEQLSALREGDAPLAQVQKVSSLITSSWTAPSIRGLLSQLDPQEVDALEHRFLKETGRPLRDAVSSALGDCPARDLCLAILDRDEVRRGTATVACAMRYGTDFVGSPFLSLDAKGRTRLIEDYNSAYHKDGKGDFWADLKRGVARADFSVLATIPPLRRFLEKLWWPTTNSYPFIEAIVRNGKLSPAELLRYFMSGIGTDSQGVFSVLANRTRENVAEIEQDYAKRYPPSPFTRALAKIPLVKNFLLLGDLRHDLRVELSGDQNFDVSEMLAGMPGPHNAKELCSHIHEQLIRRFQHENSGFLFLRGRAAALRGDSQIRKRYHEDHDAALEYYREHIASDPAPSHEKVVRFLTLARLADVQASSYRDSKRSLGEFAINVGAAIGATLGGGATLFFLPFSYPAVAASAFVGSLCWRVLTGMCILGRGFGRSNVVFQALRASIDGASMFTVRLGLATFGQFVGTQISERVAKSGFKGGLNRFIRAVELRMLRQDKARHVLQGDSSLTTDEELHETIQRYLARLGDAPWEVGKQPMHRAARIGALLGDTPHKDAATEQMTSFGA